MFVSLCPAIAARTDDGLRRMGSRPLLRQLARFVRSPSGTGLKFVAPDRRLPSDA
ncbi:MAG: hypothetical protein ACI4XG_08450 [Bradyrhizobium sp.]